MKIVTEKAFRDLTIDKDRKKGEIFEVDEERAKIIISKGFAKEYSELVEKQAEEIVEESTDKILETAIPKQKIETATLKNNAKKKDA